MSDGGPGWVCPNCVSAANVGHSGWLHQERPDSPPLPEPARLLRCCECRLRFREDGQPYDEAACRAAWVEYRKRGEVNETVI